MTLKSAARWTALTALYALPFLALYIANGMFFPFITGKNFGFRILIGIAVGAWALLALIDRRYRPQRSPVLFAFVAFVAWMAIANAFAPNAHKAFWSNYERMEGWVTLVHTLGLFLVAGAVLQVERAWKRWWVVFVGASALVSAFGLAQLAGLTRTFQSGTRIDATLGNAEYLAGYLFFALAIGLWLALHAKGIARYALLSLAGVQVLLILSTGTRGAFVGLLAAAAFGAVAWVVQARGAAQRRALIALAGVVLFAGGFYALRETPLIANNPNLSRLTAISFAELGTRTTIWSMALEGIEERPLVGWGQEGFNHVFNKYYDPSLYAQEPWFDRAHNIYLDWAIAGGIPALVLFLLLIGSAAYAFIRSKDLTAAERSLLLAILVGYGVQGLVVFDDLFTYIPLAVILAYAHTLRAWNCPVMQRLPEIQEPNASTIAAPVIAVVTLVGVWMINAPGMRGATVLIDALIPNNSFEARLGAFRAAAESGTFAQQEVAEQAMQFAMQSVNAPGISASDRVAAVELASQLLTAEIERVPMDARLRYQHALLLRAAGRFDAAQVEINAARAASPRKQGIIQEQGILALQQGDYATAEARFREAHDLDRRNTDPVLFIGAARILAGDTAGGQAVLRETFGTSTIAHQALISAYFQRRDWTNLIDIAAATYRESNDPSDGFQLAAVYFEAGRRADARTQVRAVMMAFADRPEVQSQGRAFLAQLEMQPSVR